jgi:two-component system sensor histidine kinase YesM
MDKRALKQEKSPQRGACPCLSHRVAILSACGAGTLALALAGGLACALTEGAVVWPLLFAALLTVGLVITWWFGVFLPYRREERNIQLFLEGYAPTEDSALEMCAVSPASGQMLRRMRELLDPSRIFNLNKRQAQYLALQNQISPHFLYNTLEGIRSECLVARLDSVADMTEALASFFRYTISNVENLVSVEEELQNCETYFRIQQYRFGDRLRLRVTCEEQEREDIFRCRLPKLTMQPILENCIIHGTELKVGTGNLTIHLERTEKRLLIRISDDGVGMDTDVLQRLNTRLGRNGPVSQPHDLEQAGGVALTNVNNRIRLLFGEEYGLCVFSMQGVGTDVELTLPVIANDRDVKNRTVPL